MAPLLAGGGGPNPQYLKAAIAVAALAVDIGSLQRARKTRSRSFNRETTVRPNPGRSADGLQDARMPPTSNGIRDGEVGAGLRRNRFPFLEC